MDDEAKYWKAIADKATTALVDAEIAKCAMERAIAAMTESASLRERAIELQRKIIEVQRETIDSLHDANSGEAWRSG